MSKNDHLHWGALEAKKKVSSALSRCHVKKWSSSLRCLRSPKKDNHHWKKCLPKMIAIIEGLQNPQKKYHHHWAQCMPKMIAIIEGASKPKKSIISIEQILCQKWSLSSRGLKKTSKNEHNPQQNIIMTEQISCQKWSLSSKCLKNTSKI